MCRIIKDARCLELLFGVIDSYKIDFEGDSVGRKKGLPIGNLTSQFFANFYLSALDHFILEKLKPEGYVRYMDDMVIFGDSIKELKRIFDEVERSCLEKVELFFKSPGIRKNFPWSTIFRLAHYHQQNIPAFQNKTPNEKSVERNPEIL